MTTEKIIEARSHYLYYGLRGTYLGLAQAIEIFVEIAELAEQHKRSRILFDITGVKQIPPVMDRYDLGEQAAKIWGHHLKIALVTRPKEITGFFENVAVNRGAVLKVTSTIKDAESWLMEEN